MFNRLPALFSLGILLFSLNPLGLPQPSGSAVGGHLVGTVVGAPDTGPLGGLRTDANFMTVADFGFLPNGDMLIADSGQDRIFRIGPDGIVRLFAGNGRRDSFDENVPAVDTPFPLPGKLAIDGAGNTFVNVAGLSTSYRQASYIRRIAPGGTATTVAGSGEKGCPQDGTVATHSPLGLISAMASSADGTVYFTIYDCVYLYRLDPDGFIRVAAGSPDGYPYGWPPPRGAAPANEMALLSVRALLVDHANQPVVGFTDLIARINQEGVAMRIAGSSDATASVRQGDANKVWIWDLKSATAISDGSIALAINGAGAGGQAGPEIGIIDPNGAYRILASRDGFAGTPKLSFNDALLIPTLVRADPQGNLYFLATSSKLIFHLPAMGAPELYAGAAGRPSDYSLTGTPPVFRGIFQTAPAADAQGNLYFTAAGKLYRMSPDGAITHIAGSGASTGSPDGTPPLEANLTFSGNLGIDGQANLYWQDGGMIFRRLSPQGALTTVLGGGSSFGFDEGKHGTDLSIRNNQPALIGVSAAGETFYWSPRNSQYRVPSIWKVGVDGILTRIAGASSSAGSPTDGAQARNVSLGDAYYFSVSPGGSVYFASSFGMPSPIYRIDPQGILHLVAGGDNHATVSNGKPTAGASYLVASTFRAESDSRLLLSASILGHLARYNAGANVEILRDADAGYTRRDGGFLRDDRWQQTTRFTALPDGGFAWIETHNQSQVLRRSFPVPATCEGQYSPGFKEYTIGGAGGRVTLPLTTGATCPWTVGTSSNWLEVTGPRFGAGPVNLEFRFKPNPSPLPREASLWIAGNEVRIRQQPSPAQDLFYVTPSSAEIDAAGGSVEVSVIASPALPWAVALPSQIPVQVEGVSAGIGSATFRLRMEPLAAGIAERTAMVGVNAHTILLRQRAALQPVPVTIRSTSANDTATVDLIERPLPYTAQWLPGTNHHVQVAPYRKVAERTVNQLTRLGGIPETSKFSFRTPATASSLLSEYRMLHFAEIRREPLGAHGRLGTVFEYLGEPVPEEFRPESLDGSSMWAWFPAGSTVGVLATEGYGFSFTGFSGALQSMSNPASLHMTAPVTATANGANAVVPPSPYVVSEFPPFRFYGESRVANPWPIAVTGVSQPAPDPVLFLSRGIRVGEPDWLTLRRPSATPPFTLEYQVLPDAAATVISPESPGRQARLYFHRPGYATTYRDLEASLRATPTSGYPWIAALTDAGGFRQFPDQSSYPGTHRQGFAPGMIVSLFGGNFATVSAPAISLPLPTEIAGTRVEVRDPVSSSWVAAPLFYVSPTQINFQIPPSSSAGTLNVRVIRGQTASGNSWSVVINPRSATLFSADSSGNGAAAGSFVRVLPNQTQQRGDLFKCDTSGCAVNRVAFGGSQNQLVLEIYGTGFHDPGLPGNLRVYLGGREVPVEFAGPHATFVGLDQLNIKVPADIERNADLDLYLWVRDGDNPWMASNRLTVRFE